MEPSPNTVNPFADCASIMAVLVRTTRKALSESSVKAYRNVVNNLEKFALIQHLCDPHHVFARFKEELPNPNTYRQAIGMLVRFCKNLTDEEKLGMLRWHAENLTTVAAGGMKFTLSSTLPEKHVDVFNHFVLAVYDKLNDAKANIETNKAGKKELTIWQWENYEDTALFKEKWESIKDDVLRSILVPPVKYSSKELYQASMWTFLMLMIECAETPRTDYWDTIYSGQRNPADEPNLETRVQLHMPSRQFLIKSTNKTDHRRDITIPDHLWPYIEGIVQCRKHLGQKYVFHKLQLGDPYPSAKSFGESFSTTIGRVFTETGDEGGKRIGTRLLRFIKATELSHEHNLPTLEEHQATAMETVPKTMDHSGTIHLSSQYDGRDIKKHSPKDRKAIAQKMKEKEEATKAALLAPTLKRKRKPVSRKGKEVE